MPVQRLWRARRLVVTSVLCLVAGLPISLAGGAGRAQDLPALAPHRAVYDLNLDRTTAGSGIVELVGRMVYELKGNLCKGYTQRIRFVTRSQNPKGRMSVMDLRSNFVETAGSGTFAFATRQFQNKRLTEEIDGEAKRPATEVGQIKVEINKPKARRKSLPSDVLFPIQHTQALLSAAREGQRIYSVDLFDGSEGGVKVYATTAIIGPAVMSGPDTDLPDSARKLAAVKAWPVALSYFSKTRGRGDAVPEYEVSFLFYDTGVSRKLFIDYGSFALKGRLVQLDMLDAGTCTK